MGPAWQKKLDPFSFGDESKYITIHFNYVKKPAVIDIGSFNNSSSSPSLLKTNRKFHTSSVLNGHFQNKHFIISKYYIP